MSRASLFRGTTQVTLRAYTSHSSTRYAVKLLRRSAAWTGYAHRRLGWRPAAGAPAPIADALNAVKQADFHYSRLAAVGLLTLLQHASGADALEPAALRQSAHEIGEAMGLLKSRLDKDLSLYASNVEKMAQAVELMEETVAADRRRRERQLEAAAQPAAAPPTPTEPGPSTP